MRAKDFTKPVEKQEVVEVVPAIGAALGRVGAKMGTAAAKAGVKAGAQLGWHEQSQGHRPSGSESRTKSTRQSFKSNP
jgi:hypothetical protein